MAAARRKAEVALQLEIETDEQWNDLLNKEGLIVVDVFQEWCGQSNMIFKLIQGSNQLLFTQFTYKSAKADTIDALTDYRGKCEPCFLFYAGKQLVSVIRGANAPVIVRTIQEQLEQENRVLKGEAQRKAITDPIIDKLNKKREQQKSAARLNNLMKTDKPLTICIIKPDMIAQGKKDEIIEKIKQKGYEIVEQKDVKFTEEMARSFYKHQENSPKFQDLIKYMTSDMSCILALSKPGNKDDVINSWRQDIGAVDAANDPKKDPDSLRAQYATDQLVNAIHGSDSVDSAMRELAFFFPNNQVQGKAKERTLALIRPSAFAKFNEKIVQRIKESGFEIAMTKQIQFDQSQAEQFYEEHKGKPFFNDLVKEMCSGPMLVLCLVKENAVAEWRSILGPKEKENIKTANGTLRNEFDLDSAKVNSLHGPTTKEQAQKELSKFFPMEQTIAVIKPDLPAEKRKEIQQKIEKNGFLIATKKSVKLTEEIAKKMYENQKDKSHFNDLVKLMTSGETDIYVLSRENAVQGWREIIGPVDPQKAKQQNPDSLRALYGVDILKNAVHGPTDKQQAEKEIKIFFGDIKFDESGRMI